MDQRLTEPAGEPTVRRAWVWDGEISDAERDELVALRAEAPVLRERVAELETEVKRARRDARDLRSALKWLAAARPWERRGTKRRLRAGGLL